MGELKCVIINLCSIDAFGTLGCHYCITNFLTFKQQRRVHIISLSLWDSYRLSHESCRQQDNGARHWNDVLLISVKAIKLGKALNCHGNLWHCVFQEASLRHPQSHVRLHELLMYSSALIGSQLYRALPPRTRVSFRVDLIYLTIFRSTFDHIEQNHTFEYSAMNAVDVNERWPRIYC